MSHDIKRPIQIMQMVTLTHISLRTQIWLVIALATAIRAYNLGGSSLWTDELFTRYYPEFFDLEFLWTTGLLQESSPPVYYTIMAFWMSRLGTTEAAMRSFSLLASVITLPLVYLLAKELWDSRRGLMAMVIFALSPLQIDFAQEARAYALLIALVTAALLGFSRIISGDLRLRTLCLYGVSALVALYCHATVVFFILSCNLVYLLGVATAQSQHRYLALARWMAANTLLGLLAIPELVVIAQQGSTGAGIEWVPHLSPLEVVRALSPVVVGLSTPNWFPGAEITAAVAAVLGIGLVVTDPDRRAWLALLAVPASFVLLVALASLYHSIFITRVFGWLGVPLAVLLGHFMVAAWKLRLILSAIAAGACITGLLFAHVASWREPWRDIFDEIGPYLPLADRIVISPLTDPTPFAYYAPGYLSRLQTWGTPPINNIENNEMPRRMGLHRVSREEVIETIRSGTNVWVITRQIDIDSTLALLSKVQQPQERREFFCGNKVCIVALAWWHDQRGVVTP